MGKNIAKIEGWSKALIKFLVSRERTPIVQGKTDCLMLVFDAVEVMTGVDPADAFPDKPSRGEYDSLLGGYKLAKKYSGGGVARYWSMVAEKLGMVEKPVSSAEYGDVVVVETEAVVGGIHDIMGIRMPNGVIAQGKDGLEQVGADKIKQVWGFQNELQTSRSVCVPEPSYILNKSKEIDAGQSQHGTSTWGFAEAQLPVGNWPIVTGCERLTPGCDNCPSYWEYEAKGWDYHPQFHEEQLLVPITNPDPTNFLVAAGSDLFHEAIRYSYIEKVFNLMNDARWHTFEIITKRAERLACIANALKWSENIKLGVVVESAEYKWRMEYLRDSPAKFKALQIGPILGPMGELDLTGIDKVGVINEHWGKARPADPQWIDDVKRQCAEQGVEFTDQHYLYTPEMDKEAISCQEL